MLIVVIAGLLVTAFGVGVFVQQRRSISVDPANARPSWRWWVVGSCLVAAAVVLVLIIVTRP